MERKVLIKKQNKILKSIHACAKIDPVKPINGVLRRIFELGRDKSLAFGNLGIALYEFVSRLDLDNPHPDLCEIANGELVSELSESFNTIFCDVLNVLASTTSYDLQSCVIQFIKQHKTSAWLLKNISNHNFNRFIEDRHLREESRSHKTFQAFYVDNFDSVLIEGGDFVSYARGNNIYSDYIALAAKKIEIFKQHNLTNMVSDIEKSIVELEKIVQDSQHYGFNRIALDDAAILLAKINNLIIDQNRILIDKQTVDEIVYSDLPPTSSQNTLECLFVIYPLFKWRIFRNSPEMDKLVELLEKYPEANYKPVFDNYWVLVPHVSLTNYREKAYCDSINDELTKSDKILPVLLGEKEGKHYFISYWI